VSISEPFIRRPVATSLLMAALAFVGVVAYPFLPVAPLPQVDFPTIQVTATWQGASAETMATSVAAPLERQLAQIPGVTQLTSTSALGATTIVIQFDLNRNIDSAGQDVQAAITVASKTLPQAMTTPPSYKKVNPADSPIIMLSLRSETMPVTAVDDYGDLFLAQQISQVSGVAQVSIFGDTTPSIRIQVDPAKLASTGITLEEIRNTLVASTTNSAKGTINTDKIGFTIAANDQILDADQFNDVILAYRNGAPIRVRDVGQAVEAPVDRNVAAYQNNNRGIILAVFKQPGANVIDTVDQIKAQLPQLTARIPPAVKVETILDRTTTIRASVSDVQFTLGLTIALVVLVVFLFLRSFWATAIPSITVPLALLGSCAAMYMFNFSLDNLSLMALTIAVGFVVDDAIVVVENIYRHIEEGTSPFEAALIGSREIGFTVLSISLSLVAVFIPLLLMGRHHRPHVPRVRPHRHRLDRGFRARVAHARADAVLALHAPRIGKPRPRLPHHRGGLQRAAGILQVHPRHRAAAPGDHPRRFLRHHGADRGDDLSDPQRLLPDPGYRRDPGLRRNRPGCAAGPDDAHLARVRRGAAARSGCFRLRLVHRLDRRRQHEQYRSLLHRAQVARRARAHRLADHRPAAAAAH
jgi:multidrug efflux pump subunit AcrB